MKQSAKAGAANASKAIVRMTMRMRLAIGGFGPCVRQLSRGGISANRLYLPRSANPLFLVRVNRYLCRAMAILFLIVFIDLVGFGVIIPLLPFYGIHFGASPAEVTWMMASYSLAQFFFSPLLGRLSDRLARRPVLLISLAISVLSYLWLGFANALWMLFAARLISGAGAGNIAAAQAYISDVTTPETRAKGMGMIGAAFGLGFTIGPALGGLVAGSEPSAEALARP